MLNALPVLFVCLFLFVKRIVDMAAQSSFEFTSVVVGGGGGATLFLT